MSLGFNGSLIIVYKVPFGIGVYTLSKEIHNDKACVQVWPIIDRLIGNRSWLSGLLVK